MTKPLKDYFYIDFMKNRKSKKYRLRYQLNGMRKYKYFDSKKEAESFRNNLKSKRHKVYKKGGVQYYSLLTLADQFFKERSYTLSDGTIANYRSNFLKVFKDLKDIWFHQILKEDCEKILNENNLYFTYAGFYSFYILNEINDFAKDRYNYSLNWSVNILRKKIKILKGARKKPKEFHNKEEISLITSFLKDPNCKLKHSETLYHIYRVGLSLGCRASELCSLKKINYDKQSRSIVINSTISQSGKGWKDSNITKTKTTRVCGISENGAESIEWLINRSQTKYIIGNFGKSSRYDFINITTLAYHFKKVTDTLEINWIGTHGLFRKTFATLMASSSEKTYRDMIASIQKQLGHKSPQMTLYYIQAIDTDLSDEFKIMDKVTDGP